MNLLWLEFWFCFETIPNKGVYCKILSGLVLNVKLQKNLKMGEQKRQTTGPCALNAVGTYFGVSLCRFSSILNIPYPLETI